jgi:hypothetical protein
MVDHGILYHRIGRGAQLFIVILQIEKPSLEFLYPNQETVRGRDAHNLAAFGKGEATISTGQQVVPAMPIKSEI